MDLLSDLCPAEEREISSINSKKKMQDSDVSKDVPLLSNPSRAGEASMTSGPSRALRCAVMSFGGQRGTAVALAPIRWVLRTYARRRLSRPSPTLDDHARGSLPQISARDAVVPSPQ